MKKVLILAYHFPPLGTGGVGRALGWARHLPDLGWQPVILAATPNPGWPRDDSLLEQVPAGVEVHRVASLDPRQASGRRLRRRELTFLWYLPARRAGERILRGGDFAAILATAPPPVAHAVAARLAARFDLPWLADFRDPWGVRAPGVWRRFRRGATAGRAQQLVAVNDTLRDHLKQTLGRPVTTVFNGFEPDEMPDRSTVRAGCAAFLGTLSPFNIFEGLFRALAKTGGEFLHIGATRRYDLAKRAIAQGLHAVRQTGYLPRSAALREAATGAVYVLSLKDDLELALPTKTFDYIGLGGPVLCLGEGGATVEFVRRHELGEVAPADDAQEIVRALEKLAERTGPYPETTRLEFTRRRQAERTAELLDAMISGKGE